MPPAVAQSRSRRRRPRTGPCKARASGAERAKAKKELKGRRPPALLCEPNGDPTGGAHKLAEATLASAVTKVRAVGAPGRPDAASNCGKQRRLYISASSALRSGGAPSVKPAPTRRASRPRKRAQGGTVAKAEASAARS